MIIVCLTISTPVIELTSEGCSLARRLKWASLMYRRRGAGLRRLLDYISQTVCRTGFTPTASVILPPKKQFA
jgi:hypothetical protein